MTKRNLSIDILKCLCVLFVILLHTEITPQIRRDLLFPFYASMAVPFFMTISGYNYYSSCQRKNSGIKDWFAFGTIMPKLKRIIIPFIIIIIAEIAYCCLYKKIGFLEVVQKIAMQSGLGPGGYYFCLVLQLIILFPFIYALFKRKPILTAVVLVLLSLSFEIFIKYYYESFPTLVYKIMIQRYVLHILAGMIIARYGDKIKIKYAALAAIPGIIYISACYYTKYESVIFSKTQWISTSMPTAFYSFFIVLLFIKQIKIKENSFTSLLALFGKASYHIFLFQMIFFYIFEKKLSKLNSFTFQAVAAVIICFAFGLLFYALEEKLLYKRNIFLKKTEV